MGRRALSLEEKRARARDRSRKHRYEQRQKRQAEYVQDCSLYSTVRPIHNTNDTPPIVGHMTVPGPGPGKTFSICVPPSLSLQCLTLPTL